MKCVQMVYEVCEWTPCADRLAVQWQATGDRSDPAVASETAKCRWKALPRIEERPKTQRRDGWKLVNLCYLLCK